MEDVFCIQMEFRNVQDGPWKNQEAGRVFWIMENDFPISPLRRRVMFELASCRLELLGAAPGPVERQSSALRFRHALADEFFGGLRRCADKFASISFDFRARPKACRALVWVVREGTRGRQGPKRRLLSPLVHRDRECNLLHWAQEGAADSGGRPAQNLQRVPRHHLQLLSPRGPALPLWRLPQPALCGHHAR
ncbi:hypothetical protein B484DRAFT_448238, partial [Ochromonadaceae sp. CCMP2298]